jgi:hypothetical protein
MTVEVARTFFDFCMWLSYIRREFVAANDIIPQFFAVHCGSQPRCQQERAAQLSVVHKVGETSVRETGSVYAPVEGVRFPRWRREAMMKHGRDPLSNFGGDASPCRTRPKRKWLLCVLAERCREQLQRLDVGGFHDLIS